MPSTIEYKRARVIDTVVKERIQARLRGAAANQNSVVWQMPWKLETADKPAELQVNVSAVSTRMKQGWLVVDVPVLTDATATQTMRCSYFLGTDPAGISETAAATVEPVTRAGSKAELARALADRWGGELLRVIWDGVLDCVESAILHVSNGSAGRPVTLLGFAGQQNNLFVDVQVGA